MNPYDYYSEDAELNLVRSLILHPHQIGLVEIDESDFLNDLAKKYFKVTMEMYRKGSEINLATVGVEAGDSVSFVESWGIGHAKKRLIPQYLAKVKELSVLRKVKQKAETSKNPRDIIKLVKAVEAELDTKKMPSLQDSLSDYVANWKEKEKRKEEGKGIGVITGFDRLDQGLALEKSHMVVLAARSSVGKSAFALNLALGAAMYGQKVLYFSAEMTVNSLLDRSLSILSGVPIKNFKYAQDRNELNSAVKELSEVKENLKFLFMPRMTSNDVSILARKESVDGEIDLVVVDYLQYLRDKRGRGETNNDRVGQMTSAFKSLAGELNACVLVLSQVNRKALTEEGGMPRLEHLRDSGSIEQDADSVLILNREARNSKEALLVRAKAREGVAEEGMELHYYPELTKFKEKKTNEYITNRK